MSFAPKPIGLPELALRLMSRRGRGDWAALVVAPGSNTAVIAEELAEEMESLGDTAVDRITGAADALDLASRLAASSRPAVVSGLDAWSEAEWSHLDHLRSRFARPERTALVVSSAAFEALSKAAPNFSSWLGASAWSYQPRENELTDEERDRRLESLRSWSGLSDDEVIARAERGELARDPEYAEWLVLLHREDLLER